MRSKESLIYQLRYVLKKYTSTDISGSTVDSFRTMIIVLVDVLDTDLPKDIRCLVNRLFPYLLEENEND